MTKDLIILGSTGSIGQTVLKSIRNNKSFKVKLLSANKNIIKLLYQAIKFNVKNVIIEDYKKYIKYLQIFKKKKIKLHLGIRNIDKIITKKVTYSIISISGINGLEPTLKLIPFSSNILIANKESIICGWSLINKSLKKNKTKFIPIDSEHFSILQLIKGEDKKYIDKIILTASGGPFLNIPTKKLKNINPKLALKHPNWKMGKKISIDSSTMMNKIFEFIEAKKIFNLKNSNLSIIIHPESFVHAIIYFKGDLIKFLAHKTDMSIPILNSLGIKKNSIRNVNKQQIKQINNIQFQLPKINNFPLLRLIKIIPEHDSYFETILITMNDYLVDKYLKNKISYQSIHKNLIKFIKKPYFKKYYKLKPKNIYDIKKIISNTNKYLDLNVKNYEK